MPGDTTNKVDAVNIEDRVSGLWGTPSNVSYQVEGNGAYETVGSAGFRVWDYRCSE